MRLSRAYLILCGLCLWFSGCSLFWKGSPEIPQITERKPPPGALKKKFLVLKFLNKTPFGGVALSQHSVECVREALLKHADLTVISEEDIGGIEGGGLDLKTLFEKARANGVAAIVTGTIENIGIREQGDEIGLFRTRYYAVSATTQLKIYEVAGEKELLNKMASAESVEEYTRFLSSENEGGYKEELGKIALQKALEGMLTTLPNLSKQIAWTGRIVRILSHRVYINSGESSGLKKGQLLKVQSEGHPVFDDVSGVYLGSAPGVLKGILRVVDFFGVDGAVAVGFEGGGFAEKDRVELYNPKEK